MTATWSWLVTRSKLTFVTTPLLHWLKKYSTYSLWLSLYWSVTNITAGTGGSRGCRRGQTCPVAANPPKIISLACILGILSHLKAISATIFENDESDMRFLTSVSPPWKEFCFYQYDKFFLTGIEDVRTEDVVHCRDCKAHWGNVIVFLSYIYIQLIWFDIQWKLPRSLNFGKTDFHIWDRSTACHAR